MQTTCEAKRTRYLHVVAERKACEACPGLANASRIGAGRFDADEIGAYSRWQGNLDAELMVVGQDFADEDSFIKYRGWPGERVRTNRTLVELVAQAGIGIEPPRFGTPDDRLFFTNAVLLSRMRSAVPRAANQDRVAEARRDARGQGGGSGRAGIRPFALAEAARGRADAAAGSVDRRRHHAHVPSPSESDRAEHDPLDGGAAG
jgi:hypothetical protein